MARTSKGPPDLTPKTVDYGLAPQLRARLMGVSLGAIGVVLVVITLAVAILNLPTVVLSGVVLLALIAVFGLGFLLVRRWYVVRLDPTGYRVRFVRGAGVAAARWSDVDSLVTDTRSGTEVVEIRLRNGRSTVVPVELLAGDREAFVDELRRRLGPSGRSI